MTAPSAGSPGRHGDQAPVSSRFVWQQLVRRGLDLDVAERLTVITETDAHYNAVTTVGRPVRRTVQQQNDSDQIIMTTLQKLHGAKSVVTTMGRTYTVTWDGIRRPA